MLEIAKAREFNHRTLQSPFLGLKIFWPSLKKKVFGTFQAIETNGHKSEV